ncbi:MAG TPA: FtsX-like permease family protein [Acidimicrobiia bacterium]|nr:FtsX-like permease family protein [Acidimicrobiia bacterium]
MNSLRLWLRWSWRDLRSHWVRVGAIALIIALGTGAYAGLSSSAAWRLASADHNYELLGMYDLRVRLSTGSFLDEGSLLDRLPDSGAIAAAEERLIVPTQVDASTPEETILVRGVLVGLDVTDGVAHINQVYPAEGRKLTGRDAGRPATMLERNFANFYDLPPTGTVQISGGRTLDVVGHGITPEYFIVQPEGGAFFSQANYAALFTSLDTAQDLAGMPDQVNDLVLQVGEGTEPAALAHQLERSFANSLPDIGVTIMTAADDLTYTLVYEDIDNDQAFFNMLAFVIFAGAVAAAFNLTTRLVEHARREFGIAMALGVPRRRIVLRPLLVGAQIALLGVVFGLGMGWLIAAGMRNVLREFLPFAEWLTPFQTGLFAQAAVTGFVVPFIASAIPAWRAVRVNAVDAIRTGHLAARSGGMSRAVKRVQMPGNTFTKMPFRNFVRAPRRTVLTILGIGSAVAVLVLILGAIDSFLTTVDRGEIAATGGAENRIIVDLDQVYPTSSPPIEQVLAAGSVASAHPNLRVGGVLINAGKDIDAIIEFVDFDGGLFRPNIVEGTAPGAQAGVVIAEKAADDLDISVGDTVRLRHPVREGPLAFSLQETDYPVTGIHDHPFRFYVYMAAENAGGMSLSGLTNSIDVVPVEGAGVGDVQRELFESSTVVSVQRADSSAKLIRDLLDTFIGVFQLFEGVVLLLAVLIAFNSAGLGVEERRREYATMFAFGVPRWKAVRMIMIESTLIGVLATALGTAGGMGLLVWFVRSLASQSMPQIGLDILLTPSSVGIAIAVGIVAVGLAPLLTAPRRLGRMDVPSTLRVME